MLVATFNATTGWAGREITWQDERFILEGHGAVAAADVVEYDRQGHLDWPSEEMRSWVATRLSWEQTVAMPTTAPSVYRPSVYRPVTQEPAIEEAPGVGGQPTTAAERGVAASAVEGPAATFPAAAAATASPAAPPEPEIRDVLAPAGDIVDVVGSAPYQAVLEAIVGAGPESARDVEKWAYLIPESDNPWDRNAVAVYVDGHKVGYLPREGAAAYAYILGQLWAASHARAVCRAVVSSGWHRVQSLAGSVSDLPEGQLGVRLALAAPEHFDVTQHLRTLTQEELTAGPSPV